MHPRRRWYSGAALLLVLVSLTARCSTRTAATRKPHRVTPERDGYPPTRRVDVVDRVHGVEVHDPYRWLEDGASQDVNAWSRAQDAFTRSYVGRIALRQELAARMKILARYDEQGVPQHCGGRYFFARRKAHEERAILYCKETDGRERALVDPTGWAKNGSSLGHWRASSDGKKLVYERKQHNSDTGTLHVIDVASGRESELEVIEGTELSLPQWTPRCDGFYYVHYPTDPSTYAERHSLGEIRLHKLGTRESEDIVVRRPVPRQDWLEVSLDPQGRWLVATVWFAFSESNVYLQDLGASKPEWTPVAEGRHAHFVARSFRDTLFLYSTEGAQNGEIYAVDPNRSERAAWRRIVAERPDTTLLDFDVLGGRLALLYLREVASRVEVRETDGRFVRTIDAPRFATIHTPVGAPDDDEAYVESESFTRPPEIDRTSMRTGDTTVWHVTPIDADLSRFETEQLFYPSKDGTLIPLFLVHAKGLKRDGDARVLLHGYGGFNWAQRPSFEPFLIPWLERGGVYAVANVRGGSEYGEAWHQAGVRHKKQNVFDDFIAGAEFLIRENYTRKERLAIHGLSNGGLLVAAVITQRPELFRAALCEVPLTDMVRSRRFSKNNKSGPGELGSPDDPEDFRALFAYSPYHHVVAGTKYPSVFITAGETDERAHPMHARKFAAALQAATTGGAVLLRVEWNAGHHGTDVISLEAERMADEYAFLLAEMVPAN